jgi:predicted TIM-barrel fold metal-dependent hydrolase
MCIVDSHMHVNYNGFSLKKIINYLDKNKIDCCWLLTWEEINPGPWEYYDLPIDECYEAFLKYPSRIIPMYAPDPHKNSATAELMTWHQKGIKGCGELKATVNWGDIILEDLLKLSNNLKLPVIFHMEEAQTRLISSSSTYIAKMLCRALQAERNIYSVPKSILKFLAKHLPVYRKIMPYRFPGYMIDFDLLETALKVYPNIKFVAHGPGFWKHIGADGGTNNSSYPSGKVLGKGKIWRLLSEFSNLYADLSVSGFNALSRDIDNAKIFLSQYEDKILFGTDNYLKWGIDFIHSLNLSKKAYQNILGRNACHIITN